MKKESFLSRIFKPVRKSEPTGRNSINTSYSNEANANPINPMQQKNKRGIQIYTLSQIISSTGRDQEGRLLTWGVETPYFFLTVTQRNEIFKLSTPVFGIVTSRMNRISAIDFNIVPIKHREDQIVDELKSSREIFQEYSQTEEVAYATVRARMYKKIKETLPDVFPDLSNFNSSLLRFKRRIQNAHLRTGDEIHEWISEPNNGVTWHDFVKKLVYDLHVHGCSAIYKQYAKDHKGHDRLENFDCLTGGTVYKFKSPYFTGVNGYIQMIMGYDPQMFFSNELAFLDYLPTSVQNYSMIPLEALINKVSEGLLFDRLMAEQADGTTFPQKMVIVTNNNNPFGDFEDKGDEIPLNSDEQNRLEKKLNEPKKGSIITFSGNKAELIDLSKENTMSVQNQRQKDIREEVALVFNMSNMEVNLSGAGDTSGRATSESQSEIEQGKGIFPILKLIELGMSKYILPFRFGYGYQLEFNKAKNEKEVEEVDSLRLRNGKVTINELREENNQPTFEGDEYNKPQGSAPGGEAGTQATNPLFMKTIQ